MADYTRSHSTRVLSISSIRFSANLLFSIVIVSFQEKDSCKVVSKLADIESLMKGKNDWFDLFFLTASSNDISPRFCPHRRADFSCIRAIFLYSPLFLYHQFPCIRGKKEKLRKRKPSLHSDASPKNKGTKRYWIKDTISIKKVRWSIKIHSRTVAKKGSDRKGRERDLLGLREGADRGGVLLREKRISMSE